MKNTTLKLKSKFAVGRTEKIESGIPAVQMECPPPEAFLAEAKREPKRKLLLDHSETIQTLRNDKRLTFREIAEWFNKRGFETDHSAVYRAYLSTIPPESRDPR